MTKELIHEFSQLHAEPEWLANLRQQAFDKMDQLDLPVIERVKFHRWNLGDGRISDSEPLTSVPDFTALGDNLKFIQMGTQTVLEQLPADLAEQGVVFTDFHSALEEIPQLVEKHLITKIGRASCRERV